jgi:threonine dehydratase
MLESVRAGHPLSLPEEETVASALAGGIGDDNRWSFPLVREIVTDHVVVNEDEITKAMSFGYSALRMTLEGGGAVGIAALLSGRWRPAPTTSGPVVVVVSGGNVALETLARVLGDAG